MSYRVSHHWLVSLCLGATSVAGGEVFYVDDDAPPGGDGASWSTAFRFLQDALNSAASSEDKSNEIRVAQGLYIPDRSEANPLGTGDRTVSFVLLDGLSLSGGYQGAFASSGNADHRDPDRYLTILSGDLLKDDVDCLGNNADNSYHVVAIHGTKWFRPIATIDGVIVERGHADTSAYPDRHGAGLNLWWSRINLINCNIRCNWAEIDGAGVRSAFTELYMTDCSISENKANSGGGVTQSGQEIYISNCSFVANEATQQGCALYTANTDLYLTGSKFENHTLSANGSAIYMPITDFVIEQCTFSKNSARTAGAIHAHGSSGTMKSCQFENNQAANTAGAMWLVSSSGGMSIEASTFFAGSASSAGAVYASGTVHFRNCLFVNNSAIGSGGAIYGNGNISMTNCTCVGNTAGGWGAVLFKDSYPRTILSNCIFWSNSTSGKNSGIVQGIVDVEYSLVQEGMAGYETFSENPHFVDLEFGDFRLMPTSPCIDRGDNSALPIEITHDLAANARFVNDPMSKDFGNPDFKRPVVDLGSYEFCRGDVDRNGVVDVHDLFKLLATWNQIKRLSDTDGDGDVDVDDLTIVLANWGPCE